MASFLLISISLRRSGDSYAIIRRRFPRFLRFLRRTTRTILSRTISCSVLTCTLVGGRRKCEKGARNEWYERGVGVL